MSDLLSKLESIKGSIEIGSLIKDGPVSQIYVCSFKGDQGVIRIDKKVVQHLSLNRIKETQLLQSIKAYDCVPEILYSDPQNGLLSHVSRAIRAGFMAAPDAAFLSMAGDLVSVPGIDQQWEDLFHAGSWIFGQIPLVPVMGNHAYYIDRKWSDQHSIYWRPHFNLPENGLTTLPETNYYFHYQGVLFVVLNGNEQLEEQAVWLDEILGREESTWIILSMHQPLYSTGQGRDGAKRRAAFLSVIDKYEVDLVLQGHDHTFGRTYPLKAGLAVKKRAKGTIYINSVSGSKQYKLEPAIEGVFAITDADKQFYHVIDVQSSKLKLSSYTVDGELKDEVIIKPSRNR